MLDQKYSINYKGHRVDIQRLSNGKFKKPDIVKGLAGSYAGYQPKPSLECILIVQKSTEKGKSYVDQALSNGKGVTWLDDCRIPYQDITQEPSYRPNYSKYNHTGKVFKGFSGDDTTLEPEGRIKMDDKGRFPANLLVESDVLNDGRIHKSSPENDSGKGFGNSEIFGQGTTIRRIKIGDSGSFSRYFSLDSWWAKTFPFLVCAKASKSEKNKGLEGMPAVKAGVGDDRPSGQSMQRLDGRPDRMMHNPHPTVKPLKLMSYLITMGSREGDTILDPFCGSGTTLIAAHQLHRKYIGIEISEEYCTIARKRLEPYQKQAKLL